MIRQHAQIRLTTHLPMFMVSTLISLCLLIPLSHADDSKRFTVGIVPQYTAREIATIWIPILNQAESAGVKLQLRGSSSIPDFEKALLAGEFDFAYANPLQATMANQTQGYVPIIRDGARKLYGILVVHKDSEISDLAELANADIAFPAPNALGATLLTRALFKNQQIPIKPAYVKTHSSVYMNVVAGRYVAGGGVMRSLNKQPEAIKSQLRVIMDTQKVVPHPLIYHPRVGRERAAAVQAALLELATSAAGQALFARVPMTQPVAASLQEYAHLRELGLDQLVQH